jgi:Zn-dependent M16 (insulinase) family peptidase
VNLHLKKIRKLIKTDKSYFQKLIKKIFIDNQHRVRVITQPDDNFIAYQMEDEQIFLQKMKKKLTPPEISQILHKVFFLFSTKR